MCIAHRDPNTTCDDDWQASVSQRCGAWIQGDGKGLIDLSSGLPEWVIPDRHSLPGDYSLLWRERGGIEESELARPSTDTMRLHDGQTDLLYADVAGWLYRG